VRTVTTAAGIDASAGINAAAGRGEGQLDMDRIELESKQFLTEMCFGCGVNNHNGLHGRFYNTKDGKSVALFQAGDAFQSYPDRLHGGITAAMLDEALGRSILAVEPYCWAVTVELNVRYIKPVPLNSPLKIMSEVTENNRRIFRCAGSLVLSDGEIAATATGTYMKQRLEKIANLEGGEFVNPCLEQELDIEHITVVQKG